METNEHHRTPPRDGMEAALKAQFETVALPHLDAVYRMARTLTPIEAEAEDLCQETFVRAFRAFASFELRDHGAKPWLLRILHNAFYTLRGKQRRQPTLMDAIDFERIAEDLDVAGPLPEEVANLNWDRFDEELKQAVAELPADYQTVILLWAIEDLSYKEIAEVCECALGTVMSRLYRARQLLGRSLREYAQRHNLSTARFDT